MSCKDSVYNSLLPEYKLLYHYLDALVFVFRCLQESLDVASTSTDFRCSVLNVENAIMKLRQDFAHEICFDFLKHDTSNDTNKQIL